VPEIRASVYHWTVADYRALAEDNPAFHRSELIRGIIVKKEMKTPLHDFMTGRVARVCRQLARGGLVVRQEASLLLTDSVPEPDVAVARGEEEDFRTRHPTTAERVMEIAVTSVAADREKAALYAEAGVGEYWIVLTEAEQVEVYRRPEKGVYLIRRTYRRGEVIEDVGVTDTPVAVESLFA
jgi:Uma2 family endonuclease